MMPSLKTMMPKSIYDAQFTTDSNKYDAHL